MHQGSAQWVFQLQDASATGDSRVWVSQAEENYTGTLLYLNKTYQIGSEYSWAIRDEANNIHYYG